MFGLVEFASGEFCRDQILGPVGCLDIDWTWIEDLLCKWESDGLSLTVDTNS